MPIMNKIRPSIQAPVSGTRTGRETRRRHSKTTSRIDGDAKTYKSAKISSSIFSQSQYILIQHTVFSYSGLVKMPKSVRISI
jgi:hypothetical protein